MRSLVLLAAVSVAAVPVQAARVEIILDASGSMRAAMGGETRMDAARKAIRATLAGIQPDSVVALRLYGHRVSQDDKAESCKDTELAVPFEPVDKAAFQAIVDRAMPRGQTPLTHSLEQAASDFGPASDEERVIILVSDGEESCGGNPEAAARSLLAQGFRLKVHTIGFDVDAAARSQLEAISTATGGEYHDARNADALAQSLTRLAQRSLLVVKGDDGLGEPVRGGDGYESAVEIRPGQLYRLDHHQRQGEYDYFYVSVSGRKKVTASVETPQKGVSISGDSFRENDAPWAGISLQDGARRKLGEAAIYGTRGEKKTLEGTLPETHGGRLYLVVGVGTQDQHKDGRFQVDLADMAGDAGTAADAGDNEAGAIAVEPGTHQGHLDPPADKADFLKFTADPQATYRLRLRPTNEKAWMALSVASADGTVEQEKSEVEGKPVVIDGIGFPNGGEVYVRVGYQRHYGLTPATEYALEIVQSGGSKPAAAKAPSSAAPTGDGPSLVARFISFVLWTGVPLVFGLLVGGAGGYLLGRRRR